MSQEKIKDMANYFYRSSAADFNKLPGSPLAYWLSDRARSVFEGFGKLGASYDAAPGMLTTDNNRFLRYWWEVSYQSIEWDARDSESARQSNRKWFPHNKGGSFRRWYGNQEYVVNWKDDGKEIKELVIDKYPYLNGNPNFVVHDDGYYFRESVSWSEITSSVTSFRYYPAGFTFNYKGMCAFVHGDCSLNQLLSLANSSFVTYLCKAINPSLSFGIGNFNSLPAALAESSEVDGIVSRLIKIHKDDWDSFEVSWGFLESPLIFSENGKSVSLKYSYLRWLDDCRSLTDEAQLLEKENNEIYIKKLNLENEVEVLPYKKNVTLNRNLSYRFEGNPDDDLLDNRFKSETMCELISYSVGCILGRYSIDEPGLILGSQGETLHDYLNQISSPRFVPDDDAILPLTDQEWFADDATNRFREFVRVVWGDEHLQENLDFVAESLCLHAIKPKRGESALDTIRRYLSTQFYKDHLRTYKKRPIYWLFSSGKHKAFECLVYLHRYNEGTLARMRTEYVIPLSAKLNAYAEKLEQDRDASTSASETKRLEKEIATLHKQQAELAEFDEKLRHYADQRISLDLDDGVKVNYGKFGDLLAEVKAVTGEKPQ